MSTSSVPASAVPAGRSGVRRRLIPIVALAIVALTVVGVGFTVVAPALSDPTPLAARVDPVLPDLIVAPFSEVAGARDALTGDERLRFGVMLVNTGEGDFRLRARRSNLFSDDWTVTQQVVERGGGFTAADTPASLVFAGDGHDHWHIREVESHRIETLDGEVLGEVVKQGFCFFDTDPYAVPSADPAPTPAYHASGCGGQMDAAVSMGLTIGWGDEYPWHMFEQQIEVTDLPDGTYRLRAVADPFGWFEELDETNNEYWEDFVLTRDAEGIPDIEVVARAAAQP